MSENDGFEIGYGKPPEGRRFEKGKSGNPKGRPKGAKNVASILQAEANQLVQINGPHGPKITKMQASVRQLVNKAAQGNFQAIRHLLDIQLRVEGTAGVLANHLHEGDQAVMKRFVERMKNRTTSTAEQNSEKNEDSQ